MRFLVTPELGRLARWLRLLGYDTADAGAEASPSGILIRALREERAILTRDRRWAQKQGVRVVWIRSERLKAQLRELLGALGMQPPASCLFTRCMRCNTLLRPAQPEEITAQVPLYVRETVRAFVRCPQCDQLFWRGTHVKLAEAFLREIGA